MSRVVDDGRNECKMKTRTLKDLLSYRTIFCYGIGGQWKNCYSLLKDKENELLLFDGDPEKEGQVESLSGQVIHFASKISEYYNSDVAVLISCVRNQYEISRILISRYGISEKNLYTYTSEFYEKNVYKPNAILENFDKIKDISARLADEESREYYMNIARSRITRDTSYLSPNPKSLKCGEYGDVLKIEPEEKIVDLGAYTGDTAEMYMDYTEGNCIVYACEPFKPSFDRMTDRINRNHWEKNVIPYNCAVCDTVGMAEITYDEGDFEMGMNITNTDGSKKQKVDTDTIDHLFSDEKISYIKMDIEGQEAAAIRGGKNVIAQQCPKLLISGYHRAEDLWELPEAIWNVCAGYRIYAGHSPGISSEIEFYCVADRS